MGEAAQQRDKLRTLTAQTEELAVLKNSEESREKKTLQELERQLTEARERVAEAEEKVHGNREVRKVDEALAQLRECAARKASGWNSMTNRLDAAMAAYDAEIFCQMREIGPAAVGG